MNKPIVLIVEGIDHIGKTTLIRELMNEHYGLLANFNPVYYRDLVQLNTIRTIMPDKDPSFLDEKHSGILCGIINTLYALRDRNISFIFDRLHLSGAAYALALRNNRKPLSFNRTFEQIMLDKLSDYYAIYLVTAIVRNNKASDTDEAVSAKDLLKVNEAFVECEKESILPNKTVLDISINSNGISDILFECHFNKIANLFK